MPRPVTVWDKPPFLPYVCINCGLGGPPRNWFVDLGFATEQFGMEAYAIYLCDVCWGDLVGAVGQAYTTWYETSPLAEWDSPDRVEASYSYTTNYIKENKENGRESGISGDDQGTESDDSKFKSDDPESYSNEPDEPDEQILPSFFGKGKLPR